MDNRDTFLQAAAAVADFVDGLGAATYDRPGLGDWDLRALVGHTARAMATVVTYLAVDPPATLTLATAGEYFALANRAAAADPGLSASIRDRGIEAGAALGDDPARAFRSAVAEVAAALAGAGDDRPVAVRGGSMALGTYLTTRTFELVVHGLDLARATGRPIEFHDDAVRTALAVAAETAAYAGRGPELLLALTGRTALPAEFTLVP